MSGQRLRSLRVGEYEAAFDRIANAVTHRVLENPAVPDEAKNELAEALDGVHADLPSSTRRAVAEVLSDQQRAEAYESDLRAELWRHFGPAEYRAETGLQDGSTGIILKRGARSIIVQAKFTRAPTFRAQDASGFALRADFGVPVILVAPAPLGPGSVGVLAQLLGDDNLEFVQWRGSADNGVLLETINRMLNQANRPTA